MLPLYTRNHASTLVQCLRQNEPRNTCNSSFNLFCPATLVIFSPRRSTTKRHIVTDGVAYVVSQSVCLSVCLSCKTAQPIEMPFGIPSRVGLENQILDAGAHWRHLANATEPSVCGGDATLCEITLTTRFQSSQHLARCVRYFFSSTNSRSHLAQTSGTPAAFREPAAAISGSGFGGVDGERSGRGVCCVERAVSGGGGRAMRHDVTSSSVTSRAPAPT